MTARQQKYEGQIVLGTYLFTHQIEDILIRTSFVGIDIRGNQYYDQKYFGRIRFCLTKQSQSETTLSLIIFEWTLDDIWLRKTRTLALFMKYTYYVLQFDFETTTELCKNILLSKCYGHP